VEKRGRSLQNGSERQGLDRRQVKCTKIVIIAKTIDTSRITVYTMQRENPSTSDAVICGNNDDDKALTVSIV